MFLTEVLDCASQCQHTGWGGSVCKSARAINPVLVNEDAGGKAACGPLRLRWLSHDRSLNRSPHGLEWGDTACAVCDVNGRGRIEDVVE